MPKEITITYESLYELLRREKSRPELQELDKDFFADIITYLKDKQSILNSQKSKDSVFATQETEKTKKQIENIQKILKELYEKRESKLLQLSMIASRVDIKNQALQSLLPEEKDLYETLTEILRAARRNILEALLELKIPKIQNDTRDKKPKDINMSTKAPQTKLIRVLHPIPKFLGTNLEVYGPFEQEDTINLPEKIANLLIENKRAKEIKT